MENVVTLFVGLVFGFCIAMAYNWEIRKQNLIRQRKGKPADPPAYFPGYRGRYRERELGSYITFEELKPLNVDELRDITNSIDATANRIAAILQAQDKGLLDSDFALYQRLLKTLCLLQAGRDYMNLTMGYAEERNRYARYSDAQAGYQPTEPPTEEK